MKTNNILHIVKENEIAQKCFFTIPCKLQSGDKNVSGGDNDEDVSIHTSKFSWNT